MLYAEIYGLNRPIEGELLASVSGRSADGGGRRWGADEWVPVVERERGKGSAAGQTGWAARGKKLGPAARGLAGPWPGRWLGCGPVDSFHFFLFFLLFLFHFSVFFCNF